MTAPRRIALIGTSAVGKTSLRLALQGMAVPPKHQPTAQGKYSTQTNVAGTPTQIMEFTFDGKAFSPEVLAEITQSALIYLVYDFNDKASIKAVQAMHQQIARTNADAAVVCIVLANKKDQVDAAKQDLAQRAIQALADRMQIGLLNLSAKNAKEVKDKIGEQLTAATKEHGVVADAAAEKAPAVPSPAVVTPTPASLVQTSPTPESPRVPSPSPAPNASAASPIATAGVPQLLKDAKYQLHLAIEEAKKQKVQEDELTKLMGLAEAVEKAYPQQTPSKSSTVFNQEHAAYISKIGEFATQAEKVLDGKRSIPKIVVGSILAFLAVALGAACAPIFLFAPPLAVAGIIISAKMLTLAAGLTGLVALTGSGLFFFAGREKGVASASKSFAEDARVAAPQMAS